LSNNISFFAELQRRNVYRVGIAYAIASWLLLQVIDVVDPIIGIPEWVPKLILVLLAAGLPLALVFAWAYEMTPEGLKREKDVDRSASITHETGQRLNRIIIAVLVFAVGVLLVDRSMLDRRDEPITETVAETPAEAGLTNAIADTAAPSIAVLPFANMSADESSAYFSDGLADTLLHMLAQIREIRVAARTSSFQFRDQNTNITKIAEALNVGTILEGSVQKAGNQIRVTAQLIEADTGYHLWSGNYDRSLDDVFAIQDEIANEVVAALKISLLGESTKKLSQHETENIEAYTEYLLGINDINEYSFESLRRGEQRFLNAVRLDPNYALAWARLGHLYLDMEDTGAGARQEMNRKARDAASKALDLDPQSALAIAVLGTVELNAGNDDAAADLLRRAVELGPNEPFAHQQLGVLYSSNFQRPEAIAAFEEALVLDPLSTSIHNYLILQHRFARQFDQAEEYLANLLEIAPESPLPWYRKSELEFRSGNWAQSIVDTLQAFEYDPDDPELATMIGDHYLAIGDPASAKKWYDRAVEIDAAHPVSRSAPLSLYLYEDRTSPEGPALARQLVEEGMGDRQGSRSLALQVIWDDAVRNDTWDEWLEFLSGYFPEYFQTDGDWSHRSWNTTWYMGAMQLAAGRDEQGTRIMQEMLDGVARNADEYGPGFFQLWNMAATGQREEVLAILRTLLAEKRSSDNWPIAIARLHSFDFVRDEPEFIDYLAWLESHSIEQRDELQRLMGGDRSQGEPQQKRGPT
jgi:TolB-like protein/Tfp pilus assembly protein PilF